MLLFPLFHGLLAFLLAKAYGAPIEDPIFCKARYWGSPPLRECSMILAALASNTDNQPRYFDEEQLRVNGLNWPGVANSYQTETVQLPAYWSSG